MFCDTFMILFLKIKVFKFLILFHWNTNSTKNFLRWAHLVERKCASLIIIPHDTQILTFFFFCNLLLQRNLFMDVFDCSRYSNSLCMTYLLEFSIKKFFFIIFKTWHSVVAKKNFIHLDNLWGNLYSRIFFFIRLHSCNILF